MTEPLYEGGTSFDTVFGCTVSVHPAPENLGEGVMLNLDMRQPGDGRHAEVYLAPAEQARLKELL